MDRIRNFTHRHLPNVHNIIQIPGDASSRLYYRVYTTNNQTAIIMDARYERSTIEPYNDIAKYLRSCSLHAPEIMAYDVEYGLMLLEDLGDELITRVVSKEPAKELEVYALAVDALVQLHKASPLTNLEQQDISLLQKGAEVFIEWWVRRHITPNLFSSAAASLRQILTEFYQDLPSLDSVVVLRDYHAENLLWLPQENGIWRLGIIDFQDAVLGSPAYDLMSLLEDGRRVVPEALARYAIESYLKQRPELDKEAFLKAYSILGLQRNLRIVGRFNQLVYQENKHKYAQYLPRKWEFIKMRLASHLFTKLNDWFIEYDLSHLIGK